MNIPNLLAATAVMLSAPLIAQAKTGVTFLIVGDTLTSPFTFTNISDAGEKIVGFGFDLGTLTEANFVFDTEGVARHRSRRLGPPPPPPDWWRFPTFLTTPKPFRLRSLTSIRTNSSRTA